MEGRLDFQPFWESGCWGKERGLTKRLEIEPRWKGAWDEAAEAPGGEGTSRKVEWGCAAYFPKPSPIYD